MARCMCDFPELTVKLLLNSEWFIAQFSPVVIGRGQLVLGQSFKTTVYKFTIHVSNENYLLASFLVMSIQE